MIKRSLNRILIALGAFVGTNAFAWNASYECVSNDAKKSKLTVAQLDAEILRTKESANAPDRYYRVTDSSAELIEAAILGFKAGASAHVTPVAQGTMNLTLTDMGGGQQTLSVKVGKVVTTFSCK